MVGYVLYAALAAAVSAGFASMSLGGGEDSSLLGWFLLVGWFLLLPLLEWFLLVGWLLEV